MFLPHIVYPAFRLILVNRLQKAANSYEKTLYSVKPSNFPKAWNEPQQGNQPVLEEIPLKRIQKEDQICYVSAFALRLAKLWQQPALDIANYIAKTLNQEKSSSNSTADQLLGGIWQNCSVYIAPPGWIYLELHKNSVAAWLQIAVNLPPYRSLSSVNTMVCTHIKAVNLPKLNVQDPRDSIRMFEGLHSYARCASLLRLAEQANLIQLNPWSERSEVGWHIVEPSPLIWLQGDGNLRCQHPTEQRLIAQLIDAADELALKLSSWDTHSNHQASQHTLSQAQPGKTIQTLSQAFQSFHSHCRILSEIKTIDRPLAQVRCGLILITQTLLHSLLQTEWGIEPPIEL